MKLDFLEKIDEGAYADVWRAKDVDLDRFVAVKIIRGSASESSDALAHARALARTSHPHVVTVHGIVSVRDPDSGEPVEAVVMELLDGKSLEKRLRGPVFGLDEVRRIGDAVLSGLAHIHAQGLLHGDLHAGNIVTGSTTKIIDILYWDTLVALSTAPRKARLRTDLKAISYRLLDLLQHTRLDLGIIEEFREAIQSEDADISFDALRLHFEAATDPSRSEDPHRLLDHAFTRFVDDGFVEDAEYAEALSTETPDIVILPLFLKIADLRANKRHHKRYVGRLWKRLGKENRQQIIDAVGDGLDRELPKGKWAPLLRMLAAFGSQHWRDLRTTTRLRSEKLITANILEGHKDYHRPAARGGELGRWANTFGPFFKDLDRLRANLIFMLGEDWYTQNYIGEQLLGLLPRISSTTVQREAMIVALRRAIRNDAKILKSRLESSLPQDWIDELQEE